MNHVAHRPVLSYSLNSPKKCRSMSLIPIYTVIIKGRRERVGLFRSAERGDRMMMTVEKMEMLLRSAREHRAQIKVYELYMDNFEADGMLYVAENAEPIVYGRIKKNLQRLKLEAAIVESCVCALTAEERFIIKTHMIDGLDWSRTIVEMEGKWTKEFGRDGRTLKQKQQNALVKLVGLFNSWFEQTVAPDIAGDGSE